MRPETIRMIIFSIEETRADAVNALVYGRLSERERERLEDVVDEAEAEIEALWVKLRESTCDECGRHGVKVDTLAGEIIEDHVRATAPEQAELLLVDSRGYLTCDACAST